MHIVFAIIAAIIIAAIFTFFIGDIYIGCFIGAIWGVCLALSMKNTFNRNDRR